MTNKKKLCPHVAPKPSMLAVHIVAEAIAKRLQYEMGDTINKIIDSKESMIDQLTEEQKEEMYDSIIFYQNYAMDRVNEMVFDWVYANS